MVWLLTVASFILLIYPPLLLLLLLLPWLMIHSKVSGLCFKISRVVILDPKLEHLTEEELELLAN